MLHAAGNDSFPMLPRSSTTALRSLLAAAMSVVAVAVGAEDYRWQISGGYGETELAPFADTERLLLDATYYLDPVDDARGPYALAPFLNRSSRVSAGITSEETTIVTPVLSIGVPPPGAPTTLTTTEKTRGLAVGGRYVWPASGWYVGASYRDADTDHEPLPAASQQQETEMDGYQVFGGRYFDESTSLDLGAGTTRQTSELVLTCLTSLCLSASAATRIDTDDWSIGALHVRRGSRLTYSITGRISSAEVVPTIEEVTLTLPPGVSSLVPPSFPGGLTVLPIEFRSVAFSVATPLTGPLPIADERDMYSLGAELFPTERLGFRIGLSHADGDYAEEDSYDVAATWFFKRGVAVEFALVRTAHEAGPLQRDSDGSQLRLLGRL